MRILQTVLALAVTMALASPSFAADKFIRIGTSAVGGGFYLIGNTIAQLGQAKMAGMNFTAVTGGSLKNCMNLEKGEVEFGIVQSSTLALAVAGEAPFKAPLKNLRYVTAIYPMPAHIMVRKDAGINSIGDFKGKKVDYGSVGQGFETNTREMMSVYGLADKDLKIERFGRTEFEEAFKIGRTQAQIWATTVPNAQISELIRTNVITLIGIEPEKAKEILEKFPHYSPAVIPANGYEGLAQDIHTLGAVGSLLTRATMPEDEVYAVTKMMYENIEFLKDRMPSYFANFSLEQALAGMGKTELHPGAAKFYKEKGLLK